MVLDQDFEKYEQEYLERYVRGGGQNSKSLAAKAVRERRERMDAAKKTAAEADPDSWDYVALEMIRREDLRISIKLGTMRSAESRLKLFCHGLITKRERDPTFDELERIQASLIYRMLWSRYMANHIFRSIKTDLEIGIHIRYFATLAGCAQPEL